MNKKKGQKKKWKKKPKKQREKTDNFEKKEVTVGKRGHRKKSLPGLMEYLESFDSKTSTLNAMSVH